MTTIVIFFLTSINENENHVNSKKDKVL